MVSTDAALVLSAIATARDSRISLWDAMVVQAAKRAGCDEILTEDLNDGQVIEGIRIRNPFADTRPARFTGPHPRPGSGVPHASQKRAAAPCTAEPQPGHDSSCCPRPVATSADTIPVGTAMTL